MSTCNLNDLLKFPWNLDLEYDTAVTALDDPFPKGLLVFVQNMCDSKWIRIF